MGENERLPILVGGSLIVFYLAIIRLTNTLFIRQLGE
jgi:hypothetical protein